MVLRLRKNVIITPTEYGAVALDERSGDYYQLNSTAALILDQLTKKIPVESIAARIALDFEVSKAQASADLDEYLRMLREQGLLR
uniref:Lariatin biosynthetic protein n=1 Tax=Rhodococcus jostii TaxID=132919 RepID=H7C8I5_RHOJO|nr:lariatin biosynthetic protein [Rhodococcus jostii]